MEKNSDYLKNINYTSKKIYINNFIYGTYHAIIQKLYPLFIKLIVSSIIFLKFFSKILLLSKFFIK